MINRLLSELYINNKEQQNLFYFLFVCPFPVQKQKKIVLFFNYLKIIKLSDFLLEINFSNASPRYYKRLVTL